jgi:hypothetical protein
MASGNQYFQGRLGAAKIILLKSKDLSESDEVIWELSAQESGQLPMKTTAAAAERAGRLFAPRSRSRPRRIDGDGRELSNDGVNDLYQGEP